MIAACILVSTLSNVSLSLGSLAGEVPSCCADCLRLVCASLCASLAASVWPASGICLQLLFAVPMLQLTAPPLPARVLPPASMHAPGGTSTWTKRWSGVPPSLLNCCAGRLNPLPMRLLMKRGQRGRGGCLHCIQTCTRRRCAPFACMASCYVSVPPASWVPVGHRWCCMRGLGADRKSFLWHCAAMFNLAAHSWSCYCLCWVCVSHHRHAWASHTTHLARTRAPSPACEVLSLCSLGRLK